MATLRVMKPFIGAERSQRVAKLLMTEKGGAMAEQPYVVVVGGANMDIAGTPSGALVAHDSNLGTVRLSHGGVGRNIAHNLALLGVDVRLITAFGADELAVALKAGCASAGIDIASSVTIPYGATSTYLYVTDAAGEMQVAINDMAITEHLTPDVLLPNLDLLNQAAAVVLETNLPEPTIAWLANHVTAPLFCDPISTVKAQKLEHHVGRIHTLKPNRLEAQQLAKVDIHDEWSLSHACDQLLETGLDQAFVSLGAEGLLCADHRRSIRLPLAASEVVNTTGAGDAMMAGLVWAHLQGLDLRESGMAGLAASSIAVASAQTVNPSMDEALLKDRMATLE